jgi:cell shape-determining protein MreD
VKPLAQVLFALLLAGIQAAVLRWLGGGAFSVSLLAACVVYVALHGGNVDGAVASAGVGYVLDIVSGSPKGLMTFLAVLLFVGVRAVGAAVDVRSRAGFAALSGLAAFAMSLGALILTRYTVAPEAQPGAALLPRMLLEAVITAAASPLVLACMRRMEGWFHRDEPGLLR